MRGDTFSDCGQHNNNSNTLQFQDLVMGVVMGGSDVCSVCVHMECNPSVLFWFILY